jgi:hypothetical protein
MTASSSMPLHPATSDAAGLPRHPRGPARRDASSVEPGECQVPDHRRHPRGEDRSDGPSTEQGECQVPDHPRRPRGDDRATSLAVRFEVRLVAGDAGRALAAAQGRALAGLLASLGDVEVGQDEEVSP